MSGPDEQTVERVAKAMWAVDNPEAEMSWGGALRFERMAFAAIAAMPDTAAARWESNARSATGTLSVVRAMIGEMFGSIASIESEDATLLRGPEPKHTGEAILEALQRVQSALETARNDALREAARAVAPKGDEPSVDPSNHGDTAELAYWWEAKSNEEAILALIDKETPHD